MKQEIGAFVSDEQGLTMVEYAVAGGTIAAAAITAFTNLGAAVIAGINSLIAAIGGTP